MKGAPLVITRGAFLCPPSTSPAPCCARTLPTLRRSRPRAGTKRFRIVSKPFVAAASIASGTDGGEAPDYELLRVRKLASRPPRACPSCRVLLLQAWPGRASWSRRQEREVVRSIHNSRRRTRCAAALFRRCQATLRPLPPILRRSLD